MRRILAVALLLAACGQAPLPPFGQLHAPGALAVHVPSGRIFVASETSDELRVLDASKRDPEFLAAPNPLFPLSVPTVHWPTALAAGRRIVFVLSSAEAQLAFVDATLSTPQSVDFGTGDSRFPRTVALDMLPSSVAAIDAPQLPAGADEPGDRALVAGVGTDQLGRLLVVKTTWPAVLPVTAQSLAPAIETAIALPGAFPADVQVEPGIPATVLGPGDGPIADCRTVAVADDRSEVGHTPGVILLQVRVGPDGQAFDVATPPQAFAVPVTVDLGAGQTEVRSAPVRAVAFVPAPITSSQLAAVAADPCAPRSGRLVAVLDPVYCGTDLPCRDVAFLDLGRDTSGALTLSVAQGGDAIYDVPGVALAAAVAEGPFTLAPSGSTFAGGFDPGEQETKDGQVIGDEQIANTPTMTVVTSSDRFAYLIASGVGTPLVGPGADMRAASDPVTRVDADKGLPTATTLRGSGGTGLTPPVVEVPATATPRNQTWTATFRGPLPGLANVFELPVALSQESQELTVPAPPGLPSFALPIAVVPGDVLLPRPGGDLVCPGFAVVGVAADGSSLRAQVPAAAAGESAPCRAAGTQLDVVPSEETPWVLVGSRTGFVGRLRRDAASEVFEGQDRQFQFDPTGTPADIPLGTSWTFETRSGFTFLGVAPDSSVTTVLLPSAIVALPRSTVGNPGPGFRVFITYSGTNSVIAINPDRPAPGLLGLFE